MRNVAKSMLAAAVVAAGFAGNASAVTAGQVYSDIILGTYGDAPAVFPGELTFKFQNFDVGRLYTPGVDGGRAVAPALGNAAAVAAMDAVPSIDPSGTLIGSEDSWGIFRVLNIVDSGGNVVWSAGASTPYEITGMFYGETDTYLFNDVNGHQLIHGVGMHVDIYADSLKNFTSNFAGLGAGARSGLSSYPNSTDGTHILSFASTATPGADPAFPLDEFFTNFNPAITTAGADNVGDGKANLNLTGAGLLNSKFDLVTSPDATLQFTGKFPSAAMGPGWVVASQDPLTVTAIPTPSAVWGGALLAGLVGVDVIRRRRAR